MTEIGEKIAALFGFDEPPEPGSLEVTVVERKSEEPVAGVVITLRGPTGVCAVTGADGKVRFPSLEPGPYWVSSSQAEFKIEHGRETVIVEAGEPVDLSLHVKRIIVTVTVKRDHIEGLFRALIGDKQGVEYGHWWIEIEGKESYGWWPSIGVPGLNALFGVPGQLNGMLHNPGTPTRDLHHGDPGDEEFHPVVESGDSAAVIKSCLRTFAQRYSGRWSWPWGQNCHSFQEEMMEHCHLAEPSGDSKSPSNRRPRN